MEEKSELNFIVKAVGLWRIALFLIAIFAGKLLSYQPSFPYSKELLLPSGLPDWLYSWANFDGVHYLTIIMRGYGAADLIQAFFPVFPISVLSLTRIFGLGLSTANLVLVSLIFNLVFSFISSWFLYKLVRIDFDQQAAKLSVIFLLLFPTSFFLGAMYSESLFLSLILMSFYFARKQRWLIASIIAGLVSATRVVGVLIVPALILELYLQRKNSAFLKKSDFENFVNNLIGFLRENIKIILTIIVLGSSGLIAYCLYLLQEFDDPFYFYTVQSAFGSGRSSSVILYPQVVWRSLKIVFTTASFDWRYFTSLVEMISGIGGFLTLLVSAKTVRSSYVFFSITAFLIPTLTGTFSSLPRYLLVSFALFIWLGVFTQKRKSLQIPLAVVSGIVLCIATALFIRGYWVA